VSNAKGFSETGSFNRSLHRNFRELNFIRLLLALFVLYSHSFPLGGFGGDPTFLWVKEASYGSFAVGAFFALSGLLITLSAQRNTIEKFFISRFLRVVPAYATVLLSSSFLIGPIVYYNTHQSLVGYFNLNPAGPITSILRNLTFPLYVEAGINDVFATTTPFGELRGGSVVNGSLWTLPIEVRCYFLAILIFTFGRYVGHVKANILFSLIAFGLIYLNVSNPNAVSYLLSDFLLSSMLPLVFVFSCGCLLASASSHFVLEMKIGIPILAIFLATSIFGGLIFNTIGLATLSYLIPYLAQIISSRFFKFFENDLSYGAYLWSFPIQQLIAYIGLNKNHLVYLFLTFLLVILVATLSWKFVEKPMLKFRKIKLA
jgi:peptidoglycan/LPS O-acetylase OafA/YrhL